MAECSYARCLQERRLIKRELMKWSKNMVYIVGEAGGRAKFGATFIINRFDDDTQHSRKRFKISDDFSGDVGIPGLERVAEELMGRRKWKLYQEVLARSQLNVNSTNSAQYEDTNQSSKIVPLQLQPEKENLALQQEASVENQSKGRETPAIKSEINENLEDKGCVTLLKEEKLETDSRGNSTSITPESNDRPVTPIDWKPDDKCYYCVDGKLLTVNEKGDLVAESGPALSEAELANRTSIDSDSDSRDSSPDLDIHSQRPLNESKTVTSLLKHSHPPNMTSLESMTAHLAANALFQGIQSGLNPFCPSWWIAQQVSSAPTPTSDTPAAPISPSIKDSPSPSDTTGEQPLDLSAKPSPNSSASGDPKQVFRAKPRMSAVTGRRTYTEEELHSALQDIISGKLGTRRAAVLYGIPRSTLRNKVYKIAMEQKREAHTLHPPVLDELVDPDDEDKELSGDEDKEDKLLAATLQADGLARLTTSQIAAFQKMTKGCESNQTDIKPSTSLDAQAKISPSTPTPQTPPITPNPWFDPNILLQSILLTGGLTALPGLVQPNAEDPVRELFSNLMIQQEEIRKSSAATSDILNNGKPNLLDPRLLMHNLPMLQQQQQQQQQQPQQLQHSPYLYQNRLPKSETPETSSSMDIVEGSDDPSVILKIPSYKRVVVSSSSSGKNGEHLSSPAPSITAPPIQSRSSPQQPNNLPGISPPLIRQSSESQSPPIFSLRDVIANSINRTFNQQAAAAAAAASVRESTTPKPNQIQENNEQQKRASISVIKNLGGTDISRFATTPNLLSNNSNSVSSQNTSGGTGGGGVGGKGTRPKRGKYRNYDRDSLVEAVKAVQRGEMSVHRAGSYYGVPHSTLEYKVKERHLMRPRKREPKPQPLDDRTGSSSCSSSTNSKNTSIPGIAAVSSLDKMKPSLAAQKPALKSNPPFPSTSPNGMKVPMFDPAMAAQLQYSHLFWPHTGFRGPPIDFPTTSGGGSQPVPGGPTFPPNAEGFIASQMFQRFHEENRLSGSNMSNTTNTTTSTSMASNKFSSNNSNPPNKSTREIAESLYDNGGANGSFLDGIIRKSLDRKPIDIPHGALIDQLVKNTRTLGSNCDQLTNQKTKRPASPSNFPVIDIKRERASPTTSVSYETDNRTSAELDISKEAAESLAKICDGRGIKLEDPIQPLSQIHHSSSSSSSSALHRHHHQSQHHPGGGGVSNIRPLSIEDLNGTSTSLHEKLGQIKSEKEDVL